jgi:glycosyltransferase involved in cell wall biosynthesis
MYPKFSIITVNLNNAKGLLKTIESVVAQAYRDFEFIIIDGGSNDGSLEIIKQHKSSITNWVSETDNGIYNAMNKGIAKANGEYCLFLNSGDYLTDAYVLLKVSEYLNETDIVYGDIITKNLANKETYEASPDKLDVSHFMTSTLWHPAAFIQRKLFEKFGNYDESYKIAADYAFFVKTIVKYGVTTRHIATPIAVFDLNGLSNNPNYFELILKERKKIQLDFFNTKQLKAAELLEIKTLGRNSKFFYYVPDLLIIKKLYDKFYYYWYKWRLR